VELVLAELRRRSRWLLIFDNAERPQHLADYRPDGSGHVLVTSRRPGWGALGGQLEVDVLARSETMALLQRRIPELPEELADQLATELGDLPLAAEQAAAYLEQTGLPPGDYLRRLRTRRHSLLAKGEVLGYQGTVDTTWQLSLDRLQQDSPAAVQLLRLAAFLAPEPISLRLFTGRPELLDEPLRTAATDRDTLSDVVGTMVGFRWLAASRPASSCIGWCKRSSATSSRRPGSRPPRNRCWRCWPPPILATKKTLPPGAPMSSWLRTCWPPVPWVMTMLTVGS
jgi:hypothetical protein